MAEEHRNRGVLTSLGGPEILAGSRGARTSPTSLLNAQCATLDRLTLETFPGSLSLFRGYHLNKAEATGLLGVRVSHNLALFDITILLKHLGHLGLGELGVDASDEKVRSGVDSAIVVVPGCGSILHGAVVA
jgi:hypothetical protein